MRYNPLYFLLCVTKIVSVNETYRISGNGKSLYKSDIARIFEDEIRDQLTGTQRDWLKDESCELEVDILFRISKRYTTKDLDNCLKVTLDAISKSLGFNDNRIKKIVAEKEQADGPLDEIRVEIAQA